LLTASSLALTAVWYARFYQAEPAPVAGTTKYPESLCLMLALPPSGRRVPSPPRTLLPVLGSYRLIRQSHWALLSFGYSPRLRSLFRLLPAPAAPGTFPTLSLRIFLRLPEPIPRRVPLSALAWFFLSVFGLPLKEEWVGTRFFPRTRFSAAWISRLQLFRNVQASEFARLPDRSYRCKFPSKGSRGFYVRAERASLPSHASDMLSA
jgi:hypothetical protein